MCTCVFIEACVCIFTPSLNEYKTEMNVTKLLFVDHKGNQVTNSLLKLTYYVFLM